MMTYKIALRSSQSERSLLPVCVTAILVASMVVLLHVNNLHASSYTIPDAELMDSQFVREWGNSELVNRVDVAGPGVQFSIGLPAIGDPKTGFGDSWPVSNAVGFALDPILNHYSSLAAYDSIEMTVKYLSGPTNTDLNLHLFMNTGLTGPSGNPSNNWKNDTFWAGSWVTVSPGQTVTLRLNFNAADAWNINDNPAPHTGGGLGWGNGAIYSINDRDRNEVSNIGLEIADFDSDTLGQTVVLHLNAPANVPEPGTALLLGTGFFTVFAVLRKSVSRNDPSCS